MFSFLWLATGSLRELFQTLDITLTIDVGMRQRPYRPRRISCCVDSRVRYCADSRPTHKKADCDPRDPSRNHWCLWRSFPLLNGAPNGSTGTEEKVYYAPLLTRE